MSLHDRFSNDVETAAALAFEDYDRFEDRPDPDEYREDPGFRRSRRRTDVPVDTDDFATPIPAGADTSVPF